MNTQYTGESPPDRKPEEQATVAEADRDGGLFVKAPLRSFLLCTPGPDDIEPRACDAILLSEDADVTCVGVDDTDPVTLPLPGKTWIALQLIKVTVVSAGTLHFGWNRKR